MNENNKRVTFNVDLGAGQTGTERFAALRKEARRRRLIWDGKGSLTKLVQQWADELLDQEEEHNDDGKLLSTTGDPN